MAMSEAEAWQRGFNRALEMLREGWRWHSATDAAIIADALERELGYEGSTGISVNVSNSRRSDP